ncbi:cytochrome P450 94B1-like [Pyrus x bretschneideri]|uniref:cytochrome P450 94B1-like n=1 Tax=Pyrus x bretschneideri TaxID=225117 RepID=UPI00202FA5C7|nr:cytochrome P450 94B1-like [Pyrus x bretschneideri]
MESQPELLKVLPATREPNKRISVPTLQLWRFAFNVICKVFLGVERCCLDPSLPNPPLARAFDTALEICARRGAAPMFIIWMIKRWLGVGSEQKLRAVIEEVHAYVTDIIKRRKKELKEVETDSGAHEDLLSRLITVGHEEEVTMEALSWPGGKRQYMTWLFWLLSRQPGAEENVVKEIESAEENMSDFELLQLSLLKACLYESMRLYLLGTRSMP